MIAALVIFLATYLFLAGTELPFLKLDRPGGAVAGAVAMVAAGVLTPEQVYREAISWDTIVLLLGMMMIFAQVDGTLLLFFAALFVVTHGVAQAGIAEGLYRWLAPAFGTDAVHQTFRFGAFTVAACQLVSNVPFVLLAGHWIPNMADPHLAWLSLALVATLAGNLTPAASVANLIVLELAGNKGKIPFWRFVLVGAGATFLPLVLGLATLLAERRWGLV